MDQLPLDYPFGVKEQSPVYFKSFGPNHPDKNFYVIWLDRLGSGFFSNLAFVLCHLKICDDYGMIPVVDFENFKTLYNDADCADISSNAWEYYFKPVSRFSLNEVYNSRNVFFCSGEYPEDLSHCVTAIPGLYEEVYKKYIRFQDAVMARVNDYDSLVSERKVLGVHFRGKEQNLAPSHSFGPTERQIVKYVDQLLDRYDIERVFLVSESQSYLERLQRRYGWRLSFTDSFRSYNKVNSFNLTPRMRHRFLLGLEVLADGILLSRCSGLLCSDSNVSEYAIFANHGMYEFACRINNGVNSANPIAARYLYTLKKRLPKGFGGLLDTIENVVP